MMTLSSVLTWSVSVKVHKYTHLLSQSSAQTQSIPVKIYKVKDVQLSHWLCSHEAYSTQLGVSTAVDTGPLPQFLTWSETPCEQPHTSTVMSSCPAKSRSQFYRCPLSLCQVNAFKAMRRPLLRMPSIWQPRVRVWWASEQLLGWCAQLRLMQLAIFIFWGATPGIIFASSVYFWNFSARKEMGGRPERGR